MAGAFFTVQTADKAPSKPHPGMILQALSEAGVRAEDAIMIGDTAFDIEMDAVQMSAEWPYRGATIAPIVFATQGLACCKWYERIARLRF